MHATFRYLAARAAAPSRNGDLGSRRRFALLLALLLASAFIGLSGAYAQGKSALSPVEGLDNWKYGLDLGAYPPGKYNLIVEGKDKAGNLTQAAPMNIFVDPASDLPRISIVNPIPGMRVGGDLNVVGTCVDDDGVGRVEVSLDGGEYLPAEGGQFWSLYMKTAAIAEGRRIIDVRGVDIYGLVGPAVRVGFDLDRTKPAATVENPPTGSLVSGQIVLTGFVFDANGLRSLEISSDEGASWKRVELRKGKDPLRPAFSWPVDTKKLGDGPRVFSLRSVDGVGSVATSAYLLFVDNTKPVIEVARPSPGEAVNGRFAIAGAVRDAIGVKRLSYVFGGEQKGEIPLTKGDPYFMKEFDATSLKADKAEVVLEAEDTIGNVTRFVASPRIDRAADKPVLTIKGPSAGIGSTGGSAKAAAGGGAAGAAMPSLVLREGEPIWGGIADDDGVAAFRWSLDGGAPTEIPCTETFALALPAAAAGKHVLGLVPLDINGLAGDPVLLPFVMDKGSGKIAFDRLSSAKASRDFAQGAQVRVDSGEFLEGSISLPNPLASLEYAVAGGPARKLEPAKSEASKADATKSETPSLRFKIALDRSLPYGFAPIAVEARDSVGNAFRGVALVYVVDYASAREDTGFRFQDPRIGKEGRIDFGPAVGNPASGARARPILGAFYREEIESLRLEPPTDLVVASFDGRSISIASTDDGTSEPTLLIARTRRGHEFSAGPFVFATDALPPLLELGDPSEGSWFKDKIEVTGKTSDAGGAVALSWRAFPEGQAVGIVQREDGFFAFELDAKSFPAGSISVEVTARDPAGNLSRAYRSLGADAEPPRARFVSPPPGTSVWGPEDIAAILEDISGIAAVEYAADGAVFSPIEWRDRFFIHTADFAAHPDGAYRVRDKAGNSAIVKPDLLIAPRPVPIPASSQIAVEPGEGEVRIELTGTSGTRKITLLLPGLTETAFFKAASAIPPASPPTPAPVASPPVAAPSTPAPAASPPVAAPPTPAPETLAPVAAPEPTPPATVPEPTPPVAAPEATPPVAVPEASPPAAVPEASPLVAVPEPTPPVAAPKAEPPSLAPEAPSPIAEQPAEVSPTEVSPTEASPVEADSVEAIPTEASPVEASPVEADPAEASPTEASPVETSPVETESSETQEGEVSPVEESPVELEPVELPSPEIAPSEIAPSEIAPSEMAPSEIAPSEIAPIEIAPIEITPVQEVFSEKTSEDPTIPPERFSTRLLLSGALSLKGQAVVPGQAKSVSISYDQGATYTLLAAVKDAKSAKLNLGFAFAIEATKIRDGSSRWIIKVEDFSGASYFCPIYGFADNKAPSLSIAYPEPGASALPGPFPLVVKVEDGQGVSSTEIAVGTEKKTLDLTSGQRFFAQTLDPAAAAKGAALAVAATARDAAGNQGSIAAKYAYDAAGDLPRAAIKAPDGILEAGSLITGSASDDDAMPAIGLSIDGGAEALYASGSFALTLPALSPGKHSLVAIASDPSGQKSMVKKEFSFKGEGPSFGEFRVGDSKASSPWFPGMETPLLPGLALIGTVTAPNGITSIEAAIDGGSAAKATFVKPVASGKAPLDPRAPIPFSFPLPSTLAFDRFQVELVAKDDSGLVARSRLELHAVLPSAVGSDCADAIRFADERIVQAPVDSSGAESTGQGAPAFTLRPGEKLVGAFNGRPIGSVRLVPETEALDVAFEDLSLTVSAVSEALLPPTTLELVTIDGDLFTWGPFEARVDESVPSVELAAPSDHIWVKGEVMLSGSVGDANGIVSLEVSIDGGEPMPLLGASAEVAKPATETALDAPKEIPFDFLLPLVTAPDGATRIELIARDGAGRESRLNRYFNKDTLPPSLALVIPAAGDSVNGRMTLVAEAKDGGRLAQVSYIPELDAPQEEVEGFAVFSRPFDFARIVMPLPEGGGFYAIDKAGNETLLPPDLVVDMEKDKPVAEIHAPFDQEVLRGDFAISGVAYDDDGLAAAYWSIDGSEWARLEMQGTSFTLPLLLKDTTDNEHTVEIKAEDIYGVQGDVVSRSYRISKEEPVALMTAPSIAKPVRGWVELAGSSADANGIGEVTVSVDNRVSYDRPVGTEEWSLLLDTTTLADGLHPVAVKPVDAYDTEGFYASIVAVDNTPPKANLDLPRDGDQVAKSLAVSGRVSDNVALAFVRLELALLGEGQPPLLEKELDVNPIVQSELDISSLSPGKYSLRLFARDGADNEVLASRDIAIVGALPEDRVEIRFPLEGSRLSGRLRIQGQTLIASGTSGVSIFADGSELGIAAPDSLGWFSADIASDSLTDGPHTLVAKALANDGRQVSSREARIEWKGQGPWALIDSFRAGQYVPYRAFLSGRAGWETPQPDPSDKEAVAAFRKGAAGRIPKTIEVSLDDGRSFAAAKGTEKWSFRLETLDIPEGEIHVIVRASYPDGSVALAKTLLFLDKTPPSIKILTPAEGGRFNGILALSGTGSDDTGLGSIGVALRKGDKANYEVPTFIQGIYLDGHFLGSTLWEGGVGLTFFDDNVKLQALVGMAPEKDELGVQQSFYGNVFGAKLIANIGYLPFNILFGPDWDFLSGSLGLGANFSYFMKTQSGSGLLIGAIFGQLEFPKFTFRELGVFRKYSFYTEIQAWVLSSVVSGGFIPKMSFGVRVGLF